MWARGRQEERPDRLIRTGLLGLLGALLLDFLDLIDQVVGLLLQASSLFGALHHIGLAAIEKVQVSHGIVVVRLDLDGFLQVGDAFIHEGAILGGVLRAKRGRKRIVIAKLLVDVVFVVAGTQLAIGAVGEGPID